jgi:putative redox protein
VVTIGAPFDPGHVTHNFADALPQIHAQGSAEVSLGGRPFTIGKAFVDDVNAAALAPAIAQLHAALLVLHAPQDATVSIDNAAEIFMAAKHPKSFVTLDNADHLVTKAQDAEYAADVIMAWSKRYLPAAKDDNPDVTPEGITRVTEAAPDGFLQDVQSGMHHALADEPKKYGGTDKGFTPYGFVAAGLGACTSMTIRMYARRKGWPLDGVRVDVSHAKEHATDAADLGAKIDHFDRLITLTGDLSDSQRVRLFEIADKCPVHRSLERTNMITTQLVAST